MGSPNEFGWLTATNVTPHQQATKISNEIPAALRALLLPRFSLGRSSTTLRMTYRGFVYYCLLRVSGRRGRRPLQKLFCTIRVNVF